MQQSAFPKTKSISEISQQFPSLTLETPRIDSLNTLKDILTTSKTEKNLQNLKKFRFSRNNFLSLNSSLKIAKETELLKRLDASISQFTNKNNDEVKSSMKMIDKLENKGFKLNPLIYLSAHEQTLLEEIAKQYEKTLKENNQSRGFL